MAKSTIKKQSFLVGAIIISAGGFISKLLGALYRIPLTNILGGQGMGIYQMVYPLYCLLLTVAASGIPTGIARLISSGNGVGAEKTAFRLYGLIGAIGSVIMFLLARPLSLVQGEPAVELCCKLLSPSVLFVSALSVVRGYFQGRSNMFPTAATEVSEQLIKVFLGCFLAYTFRENLAYAVASTLFAVTVSEAASALFAVLYYRRQSKGIKPLFKEQTPSYRSILFYTIPLTFTAVAMPISQLAESIIAVNLLRSVTDEATALYGIFSGCAVTIINLPVSVTYGLAAASVPKIAPVAAGGDIRSAKKGALKIMLITLAVSAPAAIALYIFAPLASRLIFRSLSPAQSNLLINLVRVMAVNAVTLSLVQTSSACLVALGLPFRSTVTQWLSCIIRVALTAALIKYTSLSITGAAIAANCSYFVAVSLNLWYIIKVGGTYENNSYRSWSKSRRYKPES